MSSPSPDAAALPPDPQAVVLQAWRLADLGESRAAWELIEPLVAAQLPLLDLGLLSARLAPQLGEESRALALLERLLSSLPLPATLRGAAHLAAASLLDRMGSYDQAFEQMRLGKQAQRQPYDRHDLTRWTDANLAYFTADKLRTLPRATHGSRRPLFIVGMPRSGTSLVEQVLSSHPQVHGGGELPALPSVRAAAPRMPWARGERYPGCLTWMGSEDANQLASLYLESLASLDDRATYVTDKMPTNYMLLGLVTILFPGCRVIHCRRNALDTCLSCYQTDFDPPLGFAHDLLDLGTCYRDYHRLMAHWKAVLDCPLMEVAYEELVADVPGVARRLLEWMELPWDEQCLRFHESRRAVATASRDQVRRPIYASSVGRWKHYERQLGELIAALGPLADG